MKEPKSKVWIKTIGVFCAPTTQDAAGALMRQAVTTLRDSAEIAFEDEEDEAIFLRDDKSAPEWSDQPIFLRGNSSKYSILLGHFWKSGENYHYFVTSPESAIDPSELSAEWTMLIDRSRQLVSALRPDAAFSWARSGDAGSPFDFRAVCSHERPLALAPWTYYDSHMLDAQAQDALRALGPDATETFGRGLVVQPARLPGAAPATDLLVRLEATGGVIYRDPLLVTP
ncbi:hypothetical protein [Noviluteimonas dokdonensis]|uniref:hypothetical protein n=1 Tax=Noviluteimonas dokdonensis TaxID=414050 RepID=UPI00056BA7AA|nr:hypothetical protein [Lysobacter dokdonensis]